MNTIREKMLKDLYDQQINLNEILQLWKEDGAFTNIDYQNQTRDIWQPGWHLDYVLKMMIAYYSKGHIWYKNSDVYHKILKSLQYWGENDFVCTSNKWHSDIGVPTKMANILLFEIEGLDEEILYKLRKDALKGHMKNEEPIEGALQRETRATGANLTDKLVLSFKIEVATGNEEGIKELVAMLENELKIFQSKRLVGHEQDIEGIKADYSFQQHLALLYLGGYGEVFVEGTNTLLEYIKEMGISIKPQCLEEYSNFILEGMQWGFRSNWKDFNVDGRRIVREDTNEAFKSLLSHAVNILLDFPDLKRREELKALLENRLESDKDEMIGNKYFWVSDYMAHKRKNYHIGLRMSSVRTKPSEETNGENVLGYYLGDGTTSILQRGDEYEGVVVAWDWNKIPGTTTAQGTLQPMEHDWHWTGNTEFVGGVSDGLYGIAAMDYNKDGVSCKKAWFMIDEGYLAMGSDLQAYGAHPIYTCINQCGLKGEVQIKQSNTSAQTLDKGQHILEDVEWVLHDGIGYLLLDQPTIEIKNETIEQPWSRIRQSASSELVKRDVFTLGIEHSKSTQQTTYAYVVLAEVNEEQMQHYSKSSPIELLINNDKIQAIYHQDTQLLQCVFWEEGSVTFLENTIIVNQPCLVMYQLLKEGYQVSIANPYQEETMLHMTIKTSQGTKQVNIGLPGGEEGGKSVIYIEKF